VFIERRDRIVDVDMLDPLVRLGPVKRELEDGKEEAPDEDVLLAARNLDAVHLVGPRVVPHAAQYRGLLRDRFRFAGRVIRLGDWH
jgi:hypothetical protein